MAIWDEINKKVDAEILQLKDYLANGHASEYHTYREVVGTISGLQKSKEIFHEYIKKYVDEEE